MHDPLLFQYDLVSPADGLALGTRSRSALPVSVVRTRGAELPVALDEAEEHIGLSPGSDSARVYEYIKAAAAGLEEYAALALLTQTVTVTYDATDVGALFADLPVGPVQSVTSASRAGSGGTTALTASDFRVLGQRFSLLSGSALASSGESLVVTYEAGYGDTRYDVPPDLRQAVLVWTADLYHGRTSYVVGTTTAQVPGAVAELVGRGYKL